MSLMICLIECLVYVCPSVIGPHSVHRHDIGSVSLWEDLDLAAFDTTSTALQQAGQIMHADKYAKWVRQVPSPLQIHHVHTSLSHKLVDSLLQICSHMQLAGCVSFKCLSLNREGL